MLGLERRNIEHARKRIGRPDLIKQLYDGVPFRGRVNYDAKAVGSSPEPASRRQGRQGGAKPGHAPRQGRANQTGGQGRKSFNPNFQPNPRRRK